MITFQSANGAVNKLTNMLADAILIHFNTKFVLLVLFEYVQHKYVLHVNDIDYFICVYSLPTLCLCSS